MKLLIHLHKIKDLSPFFIIVPILELLDLCMLFKKLEKIK